MRKTLLITYLLVAAVLAAACQPVATQPIAPTPLPPTAVDIDATIAAGLEETATAMPTVAPPPTQPPAPTTAPEPPTAAPEVETVSYSPSLTGVIWEWVGNYSTDDVFTATNDPSRYQVEFLPDGTVLVKADCNNITATYIADGQDMTITLGASTLVTCPEDSQADLFQQQIATVIRFGFAVIGNLGLILADGSLMVYTPKPVAVLPTPEAGAPSLTATTNVNVRSGPGEMYPIYGVMPVGRVASLTGTSEDGGWWVVSLSVSQGSIGWVSGQYSTAVGGEGLPVVATPPLPDPLEPVPPAEGDPQATTTNTVYVRQGPGEVYPAYGTAPAGVTGLVIGRSQDNSYWVVRINPTVVSVGFGWVEASSTTSQNIDDILVILAPPLPQPVQTNCSVDPNVPYGVATTAVNVREGPSTEYPVVATAQQGQCGQIVGRNEDSSWWAVSTSVGVVWVSAAYVNAFNVANVPVLPAPPLPEPLPTPQPPDLPSSDYVMTTEPVNVRTGPSNEFPSLGKVPAGTVFQVLGSASGWLNVALPGHPNNQGWISENYVIPYMGPMVFPY